MAGIWLLVCLPATANPSYRLQRATLIAQNNNLLDVSLRTGSEGPRVIELQRALETLRLFDGSPTGLFGEQTRHAVRQFQRINRLEVTGVADIETLRALGLNPTALFPVMIHPIHGGISTDRLVPGTNSSDVLVLQHVLNSFGFKVARDQDYGTATEDAVLAYQAAARLSQSGIADSRTLEHMGFEYGRAVADDIDFVEQQSTVIGGPNGESSVQEGRYIAAIIAGPSELRNARQHFPNATVESSSLGEYISLGRFRERSAADARVDYANDLGYNARILRD